MSDNPYAVPIGVSTTVYNDHEGDDDLHADLIQTIGWLEESIESYKEVAEKIEANRGWFERNKPIHPKYEYYSDIFNDQVELSGSLLERMRSLRELGIGESGRMTKEGYKKYKDSIKRFTELAEYVRTTRAEVSERDGIPF